MRGLANVGKNATDLRKSVLMQPYSKVIVNVDEETGYEVGNDTGMTLELDCPWGTQEMANDILDRVRGYQYQPYTATGVIMNPAIEMGDAVQINGVYGGVYQQDATFGHTFYSDLSAPEDEQLDHEFTYESEVERKIIRQRGWTRAEMRVLSDSITAEVEQREADGTEFRALLQEQAQEIQARVSQTGGDASSFGWSLLATEFSLSSGNTKVFTCDSSGVSINGVIRAKSGLIGCNSSYEGGFEITTNAIRNGKTSYSETANNGVYLGTNGIGLGKGVFYVDSSGALHATNVDIKGKVVATSGEFKGKVTATDGEFHGTIKCKSISFDSGVTINGSNITNGSISDGKISDLSGSKVGSGIAGGNINGGSVAKGKLSSGCQSDIDEGKTAKASYDSLVAGSVTATWLQARKITATRDFIFGSSTCAKNSVTISGTTIKYVGWS